MSRGWQLFAILVLLQLISTERSTASATAQPVKNIKEVYTTLDFNNIDVIEAFRKIENATGFSFSYNITDLGKHKVKGTYNHQSLYNILLDFSTQLNLDFRQLNDIINVKSREKKEKPRVSKITKINLRVQGTVTDQEAGEGLPGVNIIEKGTSNGTVTDIEGSYSLNVSDTAVLLFSSIGYVTQEIDVDGRSTVNVTLSTDVQSLQEVVVVGYGTQKKADVTGAIASVSAEQIKDRPVTNFTEALAGQMAGVQVQQIDGAPGGAGLSVRVRGIGSISAGSSPLYVVDGYPIEGDISMISPNDIESIQVLKDASATAIYGSRGGNGVVMITTKKGVVGKPQVAFNTYVGLQQVARKVDMMNSEQYVQWFIDGHNNAWVQEGGNASDPNEARPSINYQIPEEYRTPENLPNTNWQDEIFRTAPMQSYQLSVSGGTENTRYMISGNYVNQQGIVLNTDYSRYNLRSNVSSQVNDKLEIGLNLDASMDKANLVENGKYGPVQLSLVVPSTFPVYNADGSFSSPLNSPYSLHQGDDPNPVEIATQIDNAKNKYRTLGQVFGKYQILDGLTFKVSLGGLLHESRAKYYRPSYVNRDSNKAPNQIEAESTTTHQTNWLWENTLTYDKVFGGKHAVNALIGFTQQKDTYEDNYIFATNFPYEGVRTLNNGQVTDGSSTESEYALVSYLARVNYTFDDKYLFTGTIRADGSSRFGADSKWGVFPSLSLGWRVSEEDFLKQSSVISDLKIRTSYGYTGNNSIPNYGSQGLLGVEQYVLGNSLVNAVYPSTISNPELGWEMTRQLDVGVELGLLANRISVEADYYYRSTKDLLLFVPVPQITGYATQLQNIGKVQNQGVEFSATTRNLVNALKWNTNFNISVNRNKVLALGPDDNPIYASAPNVTNGFKTEVGQPIANFYGYVFDGVYTTQDQIEAHTHLSTDVPGDPIIRDVNGDGKLNADDRTVIGNNQPDFMYGFTNDFSYKNFDLRVQLTGSQGGEVFSMSSRFTKYFHGERNARVDAVNRWRSPEQPGDGAYFRANRNYLGLQKEPSSYWIQDASFLRIRNVTLGYNLPESVLGNSFIQSSRFYFSVQNLYTFTNYFGFDPEVSTSGDGLTRGGDYTGYPTARTFTLGVNLRF